MNQINYIEFWTGDPKRLATFLADAFGWKIHPSKDDGYTHWESGDADRQMGGIHFTNTPADGSRTMAYVQIDNIEQMVLKVETAGGKVVYGPEKVDSSTIILNVVAPEGTPIGMWHKI